MKSNSFFRPSFLPALTLVAGILGLILQAIFLITQVDNRGLLNSGNFLNIFVYIITACTLALILLCALPLKAETRPVRKLFPGSILSFIGCIVAGVCAIVYTLSLLYRQKDFLTIITTVFSFIAAGCFGLLGNARRKGGHPHYGVHAGIIVFFMLTLICQYRIWSPEPQLVLYFHSLLGSVFLILSSYHGMCLDTQKGKRWLYVVFNQAALLCCCIAVASEMGLFYLGMGVFCATNLCSLRISRPRSTPDEV